MHPFRACVLYTLSLASTYRFSKPKKKLINFFSNDTKITNTKNTNKTKQKIQQKIVTKNVTSSNLAKQQLTNNTNSNEHRSKQAKCGLLNLNLPSRLSASFSSLTECRDPNDSADDIVEDLTSSANTTITHNFETDMYLEKLNQDNEKVHFCKRKKTNNEREKK